MAKKKAIPPSDAPPVVNFALRQRLEALSETELAAEAGRLRRDLRRGIISPEDLRYAADNLPEVKAAILSGLLQELAPPSKPLGRPPTLDTKIARHRAVTAQADAEKWDAKWTLVEIHRVLVDILEALKK